MSHIEVQVGRSTLAALLNIKSVIQSAGITIPPDPEVLENLTKALIDLDTLIFHAKKAVEEAKGFI